MAFSCIGYSGPKEKGVDGMTLSYEMGVTLLSLALFGGWCFLQELWCWLIAPRVLPRPRLSFLLLVHDIEQEVEALLRHLQLELETAEVDCDVIVLDCGSADLTPEISARLENEFANLRLVRAESADVRRALMECRGEVVHVLDTVHRITPDALLPTVRWVLKGERRRSDAAF